MGVKHTYKNMESSYARVDVVTATNAREEMLANSDLHKKKKTYPFFRSISMSFPYPLKNR